MENVLKVIFISEIIFGLIYFIIGFIISQNVKPPLKAPKPFSMVLLETVNFGAPESESAPCEVVFVPAPKYNRNPPKMIFMKDHIEIRIPKHGYLNYDISYNDIRSVKFGRLKPFLLLWNAIFIGICTVITLLFSIMMPLLLIGAFVLLSIQIMVSFLFLWIVREVW